MKVISPCFLYKYVSFLSSARSQIYHIFFCVGVVYLSEYDACAVTLSVYPHRAGLQSTVGHRTMSD